MSKIVVLGSCMIDFVSYSSRLPQRGETLKGASFMTNQGGKGANQCMAAAKLGGDVSLIARLGNDHFGLEYLKVLQGYNVNTAHTHITQGASGIAQIMVDSSKGDNCIVIVPGVNNEVSIRDLHNAQDVTSTAKVLVCQLEIPIDVTIEALEQFKGISILNAAPAVSDIDKRLLKNATIFCVNETEAAIITGLPCSNLQELKVAVKKLIAMGCNTVIITIGDEGALIGFKDKDSIAHVITEKVTAVDTTGAGDCFVGCLAFLLAEHPHLPFEKQVEIACKLASYSVQFTGTHTAFPDKQHLNKYL